MGKAECHMAIVVTLGLLLGACSFSNEGAITYRKADYAVKSGN